MDDSVITALRRHAEAQYPRECCGLVVSVAGQVRYWPCRNTAQGDGHFAIDPDDYAAAEDAGQVQAVCHSHPNANPEPSDADRAMCEITGLPWVIVNWPLGTLYEFGPVGWRAGLIGRTYVHGVFDCYGLVRDYYREKLGIALPDFEREERWWKKGADLYGAHAASAGFRKIAPNDLRRHDLIIMRVQSRTPNHAAIYTGDGCMLHHLMNHLSGRVVYGGWYRSITAYALRHESQP